MIAKAKKEKIVVANKNLYDYFFTTGGDCKGKVSAARLPYFDGDYWPGAAEDILQQLQQEKEGYYSQRRGKTNKIITKRTTKTSAQTELAGGLSKDLQLMNKVFEKSFSCCLSYLWELPDHPSFGDCSTSNFRSVSSAEVTIFS